MLNIIVKIIKSVNMIIKSFTRNDLIARRGKREQIHNEE